MAEGDEVADSFTSIDEIQKLGVNVADIGKLKAAGLHTCGLVLSTPTKRLLEIKGIRCVRHEHGEARCACCALSRRCLNT